MQYKSYYSTPRYVVGSIPCVAHRVTTEGWNASALISFFVIASVGFRNSACSPLGLLQPSPQKSHLNFSKIASEFQSAVNYGEILQQCSGLIFEIGSSPVLLAKPPSQLPSPLPPQKLKEALHGGRHGGVITGNAALPGLVTVFATSTACPRKIVRLPANRGLMPEDTTPLALVHSAHRRSWRRRFRLIPPSPGLINATSPRMLLLLLPGTTILPPHHLQLLPRQLALPRHNNAPSAAPAGEAISCLVIPRCRTQTRCFCGAPQCRRVGESGNTNAGTQTRQYLVDTIPDTHAYI